MTEIETELSPADCDRLESRALDLALDGKLTHVSRQAIEGRLQMGLPLTVSRDGKILRIYPDGRQEVLEELPPLTFSLPAGVRVLDPK